MPEPQEADRPNPFSGPLSPDADSVVQMFLMNQQTNRGQQPVQRPIFVTGLSATSPGGPGNILFCSFGGILLGPQLKSTLTTSKKSYVIGSFSWSFLYV